MLDEYNEAMEILEEMYKDSEEELVEENDGQPDEYKEWQDFCQDGYFENMTEDERI